MHDYGRLFSIFCVCLSRSFNRNCSQVLQLLVFKSYEPGDWFQVDFTQFQFEEFRWRVFWNDGSFEGHVPHVGSKRNSNYRLQMTKKSVERSHVAIPPEDPRSLVSGAYPT